MKLAIAALVALVEGSSEAAPFHVPLVHAVHHHGPPPPLPAAYTAWRPDPNELKDVLSGKKSLLHTGSKRHRKHGKASDVMDDDEFDMSSMFKVHEPKQTFTMDESSTIMYAMLGQLANPKYLEFAVKTAKEHHLDDAKQAKVVASLRLGLSGFKKGGHDFMLDAAAANYPHLTQAQQRTKLIEMLEAMLKHATTAKPPEPLKHSHAKHAQKATDHK
jgi:hypothetical protein